jgi:hypothetical protein
MPSMMPGRLAVGKPGAGWGDRAAAIQVQRRRQSKQLSSRHTAGAAPPTTARSSCGANLMMLMKKVTSWAAIIAVPTAVTGF